MCNSFSTGKHATDGRTKMIGLALNCKFASGYPVDIFALMPEHLFVLASKFSK